MHRVNEKLLDILMSESNQKEGDDIDYCNIMDINSNSIGANSEMQPIQRVMSKQAQSLLHQIEEDCESGGTEKSTQIEEIIKHDTKKVRTVNFDFEESVQKPPRFSIKKIKLPAH